MILGRSTVQWVSLITATAGLIQVVGPALFGLDAGLLGVVLGALVAFLGVFVAFLANTATTPIADPRLSSGTIVTVLNDAGKVTEDKVVIAPTPPGPQGISGN